MKYQVHGLCWYGNNPNKCARVRKQKQIKTWKTRKKIDSVSRHFTISMLCDEWATMEWGKRENWCAKNQFQFLTENEEANNELERKTSDNDDGEEEEEEDDTEKST